MSKATDDERLRLHLLGAWDRWDEKPGHPERAQEMDRACSRLAAHVGLDTSRLRRKLTAARRSGLGRRQALAYVMDRIAEG